MSAGIKPEKQKCGGEAIPRPFSKKSKWSMSLDKQCKVLHSFFIAGQVEDHLKILKVTCRPLAFISYKAFSKLNRAGTFLPDFVSA